MEHSAFPLLWYWTTYLIYLWGKKMLVPIVTLEGATGKRQTNQSVLAFLSRTEMTFTLFQICPLTKVGVGSLLFIESQGYSDI